ncbi:MAG: polysaccharide deacetylase family protein, partial [bacterium]
HYLRVLNYHRFDTGAWISTPMKSFKKQMDYLRNNEYNFLTVQQVISHVRSGRPFPKKSVLITVDDGYKSIYTRARSYLKKHNIPVALHIYPKAQYRRYNSYISSDTVEKSASNPLFHVGNHSYSHHSLLEKSGDSEVWRREVVKSGHYIRDWAGEPPLTFAVPYGNYDHQMVQRLTRRYPLVFSSIPEVVAASDTTQPIGRFMIDRSIDMRRFKDMLAKIPLDVQFPLKDGRYYETIPDTLTFTMKHGGDINPDLVNLFLNGQNLTSKVKATDTGTFRVTIPDKVIDSWNQLLMNAFDRSEDRYRLFSVAFIYTGDKQGTKSESDTGTMKTNK